MNAIPRPAPPSAAIDPNAIFGDPTRHLIGVDGVNLTGVNCAIGKNAKTNPNYVAKTYTIPARFRRWIQR